jgi:hypothetical protein
MEVKFGNGVREWEDFDAKNRESLQVNGYTRENIRKVFDFMKGTAVLSYPEIEQYIEEIFSQLGIPLNGQIDPK